MSSRPIADENREKPIWVDLTDNNCDEEESEIQEMSPPSGIIHPPRALTRQTGVTPSPQCTGQARTLPMLPLVQTPPPRRRPRGSEVGKSIHKAAEASRASPVSPVSSIPRSCDGRFSVASAKRIVPSTSDLNTGPNVDLSRPSALARKSARAIGRRESGSRKRRAGSRSENESNANEAATQTQEWSNKEPKRRSIAVPGRLLAAERELSQDTSSVIELQTNDRPQVARKTTRVTGNVGRQITSDPSVGKRLFVRAARKYPPGYARRDPITSDSSENSDENDYKESSSSVRSESSDEEIVSLSKSDISGASNVPAVTASESHPWGLSRIATSTHSKDQHRGAILGTALDLNAPSPEPQVASGSDNNLTRHTPASVLSPDAASQCNLNRSLTDIPHIPRSPALSPDQPSLADLYMATTAIAHGRTSDVNPPSNYVTASPLHVSTSVADSLFHSTQKDPSESAKHESVKAPPNVDGISSKIVDVRSFVSLDGKELFYSDPTRQPPREDTPPSQPLIDAFETLSLYPLLFQRANRLPFLLRNVRRSFRNWCRELQIQADNGTLLSCGQMVLTYEYTSPLGESYTFQTEHPDRECPLCSIFGRFSSWAMLQKHVRWDHVEAELELRCDGPIPALVIRMNQSAELCLAPSISSPKGDGPIINLDNLSSQDDGVVPLVGADSASLENPIRGPAVSHAKSAGSHSCASSSITSSKVTTPNEGVVSPRPGTPEKIAKSEDLSPTAFQLTIPPIGTSLRLSLPPASPRSKPPTPPPMLHPHGPAYPIIVNPGDALTNVQPPTYRPTGPHLYDHLSFLPLDVFGYQSWFVLDKEEEIFELTDVLDEDKVICALWGRWILLNRSFFIANYYAGVQSFVDEYWPIIHRAAGWAALRAWLLVLVSRRFLKNIEMVQLLRRYNGLVGKEKWQKT